MKDNAEFDIAKARDDAAAAADDKGMCLVVATHGKVRDNGHTYGRGDEFHMHRDLVPAHMQTEQVTLSGKPAVTPANKQQTSGANKS